MEKTRDKIIANSSPDHLTKSYIMQNLLNKELSVNIFLTWKKSSFNVLLQLSNT